MTGCNPVETFSNMIVANDNETRKMLLMTFVIGLTIKILLLFVVAKYLWPRVMPRLFTSAVKNPKVLDLFLLVVMMAILF